MTVGCVVKLLQCAEIPDVLFKQLLIVLLRFGQCRCGRWPFAQIELLAWRHVVGLRIDRHGVHLPLQIGWLQTIRPMALAAGQWVPPVVETLRISIDWIDQESEQLCSRQAEGRALMDCPIGWPQKRPRGVEPYSPEDA